MRRVLQVLKWTVVVLLVSLALLWIGDTLYARYRMGHKTATDPIDTIKVRPMYLIPRKDGRAELDFGDPETQMCVYALFPQLGYDPCWYVVRRSKKPIPIADLQPLFLK
ncbi:MAG TPA: hypothetical protein VG322_09465 [Candidatus Acidoferrales bacterium]|nr:hypothetical protein [Candidatus Acidoferrales bacterium]